MFTTHSNLSHDPWCSCRTTIVYLDTDSPYAAESRIVSAFRPLDSMLPAFEDRYQTRYEDAWLEESYEDRTFSEDAS